MPELLTVPSYSFRLPWFLIDIDNFNLITSAPIPEEIKDSKKPTLVETPVPGLGYQPVSQSGLGNRHVSFTIPAIKKNNTIGNQLILKQFDALRHMAAGFLDLFAEGQFVQAPKVLYQWGTGSLPLVYWVAKCDFTHKAFNQLGFPQWTDIDIELVLDEEHPLYKAEEAFRNLEAKLGTVANSFDVVQSSLGGGRPY